MVSGVSSKCQMVSGGCLCREILLMHFYIRLGVVRSLQWGPLWSSGKTLAVNAGGRGFESHRGHKNLFFTFYSIRVECEKLFCKTNIKLLKLTYISIQVYCTI